ncbi:MAG: xanthine dehydrogenase family protein molybdopterin-binding subunit, partial [Deltaproteobacteria bacterium]|nr:xanthine dehydrogenase family protein molybdopterin-binding subunit [Deltaproteobacteria bacterium]
PGTLWARALRSPYPHARIVHIDTSRAEKAPGVRAVLTGANVRGILYGRRYRDLRVLAQDRVLFIGERVAAVAADDPETAQAALELIRVDYEDLPAVFDPVAALREGAPILHPDVNSYPGLPKPLEKPSNAYVQDVWKRGDVEAGFAQSDLIVENTFTVPRVHQAFLEPHSSLVWIDDQGRVQVWSSSKAPHVLKQSLAAALDIPKERIRVNPVSIGGDFGGKGGPLDEPLCYFLALRSGRPVKMVMEYQEEFTAGAPRHAAVIQIKTGVKRDGTLIAHQMEAFFDSGAYGGLRPGPSFAGAGHASGCYRIPHARITVMRVYTNNIPGGQMRAPGEPQAFFAAESQMDCVARRLGIDPLEFRLKNLIEEGEPTVTGAQYQEVRAKETLNAVVKASRYKAPKAPYVGRGIAMGYRSPGGGATSLAVTLNPDGSVVLHTPFFEQGTGTYTTLKQIVAEELSLNPDEIQVKILDTDGAAFDSGIGGSRGTRIASGVAFQAAREAREELLGLAEKLLGWPKAEMTLAGREIVRKRTGKRQRWDQLLSRAGRSITRQAINRDEEHAPVTAFTAQVAEVSVDAETGQIKLLRFTTAHDTGIIMNPIGHQGQIEGGVIQGVGYGLMEQLVVEDGRVGTLHFGDYKIPTAKDIPELTTVILKGESGVGPYKIKGIGENPIVPVAAAIANAVEDAAGVRIRELPVTAEKVYKALRER